MRECDSLNDLLRFSRYLNTDACHAIRPAVTHYAQRALESEWVALSDRRRDKETEDYFANRSRHSPAFDRHRAKGWRASRRPNNKKLTRIPPTLLWLVNT